MDGWETNSQPAGQSQQQSNPKYQHPWPQCSQYKNNCVPLIPNTMALPVIATLGMNMSGQYFTNQGAQVFNSF